MGAQAAASLVFLLAALSGCLGVQRGDEGPGPDYDGAAPAEYEPIPARAGAYQFAVPGGATGLNVTFPEGKPAPEWALFGPEDERVLYSSGGRNATESSLPFPDDGRYVLFMAAAPAGDVLVTVSSYEGPEDLLVLPLDLYVDRRMLADRTMVGSGASEAGVLDYPTPPLRFALNYVGAGSRLAFTVAGEKGVAYEYEESLALSPPGGSRPFPADPRGALHPENLVGRAYDWSLETDLGGQVYLSALLYQPAPVTEVAARVAGLQVVDEEELDDAPVPFAYTNEARRGSTYAFEVPHGAQELILELGDPCPDCYGPEPEGFDEAALASLFSPDDQRIGLFEIGDAPAQVQSFAVPPGETIPVGGIGPGKWVSLGGLDAGTYVIHVHRGRNVQLAVTGDVPADPALHELLQEETKVPVSLPLLDRSEDLALEGAGPVVEAFVRSGPFADDGFEFYAVLRSATGVALQSDDADAPPFGPFGCYDPWCGQGIPAAYAPGDYALHVEATGGVGTLEFGVTHYVRGGEHEGYGGAGAREAVEANLLPDTFF